MSYPAPQLKMNVKRVVPLALGLLSVSNPQLSVMDTLSKLSHDQDQVVSQNAILAMGFLGAGTVFCAVVSGVLEVFGLL